MFLRFYHNISLNICGSNDFDFNAFVFYCVLKSNQHATTQY
jgi:hypothetical protein